MADAFSQYQAERATAEKDLRTVLAAWAMTNGPSSMTVKDVKSLQDEMSVWLNVSSRRFWELGQKTASQK